MFQTVFNDTVQSIRPNFAYPNKSSHLLFKQSCTIESELTYMYQVRRIICRNIKARPPDWHNVQQSLFTAEPLTPASISFKKTTTANNNWQSWCPNANIDSDCGTTNSNLVLTSTISWNLTLRFLALRDAGFGCRVLYFIDARSTSCTFCAPIMTYGIL